MAELADALDSGSSDFTVIQVQVLLSAPYKNANFDTVSIEVSVLVLCPKSVFTGFFAFLCSLILASRPSDTADFH